MSFTRFRIDFFEFIIICIEIVKKLTWAYKSDSIIYKIA